MTAGIADSPLPVLQAGVTTLHLYSVPGVVNNGGMATAFSCTSASTASIRVGVEIFPANGGSPLNNAATSAVTLAAGGTVLFVSSPVAALGYDADLGLGTLTKGSARIISTSKSLICTAFALDATSAPPSGSWELTIIAKVKQKAAN